MEIKINPEFEAVWECQSCQELFAINKLCCPKCGGFKKEIAAAHRKAIREGSFPFFVWSGWTKEAPPELTRTPDSCID